MSNGNQVLLILCTVEIGKHTCVSARTYQFDRLARPLLMLKRLLVLKDRIYFSAFCGCKQDCSGGLVNLFDRIY